MDDRPTPAPSPGADAADGQTEAVRSLVAAAVELELMGADVADAFLADPPPAGVEAASKALVDRGVLTPFQAGVLARGKGHELRVGNYVIRRPIGQGGMGKVYLAYHRRLRKEAAIKIVDPTYAREERVLRRFEREVETTARLSHPNLVAAFDAGEVRGRPYLVMEYVDGADLNAEVRTRGPLPLAEAVGAILQASRGVREAHRRGIVHRDLKPHNLLRARDGTVKVSDLGLARVSEARPDGTLAEHELTRFGSVLGTVYYIPPEQARNAREADERSDIYSLGCTLHTLLTGRPPYRGETAVNVVVAHRTQPIPKLRDARPDVPEALDDLFARMLAKDPRDRPQTIDEVIAALESIPLDAGATEPPPIADDGPPPAPTLEMSPSPLAGLVLEKPEGLRASAIDGSTSAEATGAGWRVQASLAAGAVLGASLLLWFLVGRRPVPDPASPSPPPAAPGPVTWVTPPEMAVAPDPEPPPEPVPDPIDANPVTPATAPEVPTVDLLNGDGPPGEVHAYVGHTGDLRRVAVTPDGRHALTGSSDGTAKLWNLSTGDDAATIRYGTIVDAVAVGPDGRRALVAGAGGAVLLVELDRLIAAAEAGDTTTADATFLRPLEGHTGAVNAVAFSADGTLAFSAGADGTLRLWDAATGEARGAVEPALIDAGTAQGTSLLAVAATAAGGGRVVIAGSDRYVRVERLDNGEAVAEPLYHPDAARDAAFTADGRAVLTAGLDGLLRLWDLRTGRLPWRIDAEQGRLLGLAIDADDRLALTVGARDLVLRELADGRERYRYSLDVETRDVAFVPGRDLALTSGADGRLRLWRLPDRSTLPTAPEPTPAAEMIGAGTVLSSGGRSPCSVLLDADERALVDWLDRCRESGLIPTLLDAYDSAGLPLYGAAAVPNPDGRPWRSEVIRGDDRFEELYQQAMASTPRNELLALDLVYRGGTRFSLVLFAASSDRERTGGRPWKIGLLPDPEVIAAFLRSRTTAGHRPDRLASYVAGGDRRLAIQTIAGDGLPWDLRADLTADSLSAALTDARRRGLRPLDLTADAAGDDVRYSLLLLGGPAPSRWSVDPDLSGPTRASTLATRLSSGDRPAGLTTYWRDGRPHTLALWYRP